MHDHRRRIGFTLIEVLVVIVIIGVLVALLIPAVQAARESARRSHCNNNLRQMALGLSNYESANHSFPSGFVDDRKSFMLGLGWAYFLLPHLEQSALYNAANLELSIPYREQDTVRRTSLALFLCPSSPQLGPVRFETTGWGGGISDAAAGQYTASSGYFDPEITIAEDADGLFFWNSHVGPPQVVDGLSNTLAFGERSRNLADAAWIGAVDLPGAQTCTSPGWPVHLCERTWDLALSRPTGVNAANAGPDSFWSLHAGGANFAFADGSVRFIKQTVNVKTLYALATRAKSEVVDAASY